MAKKKEFDFKKWLWIGAVPTAIGAILISARVITTYADLPENQKKIEKKVDKIERYIEVQQTANELVQKQINGKKEIVYSEDGKKYWDEDKQGWRPIKEIKKGDDE